MTTVVNISAGDEYDVYIGRAVPRLGLPASPFANPFRVTEHCGRARAIVKFREWFLTQPELMERAKRELRGKRLGCWCAPLPCHGDVLVEIVEAKETT